jgi:hypothetical protein
MMTAHGTRAGQRASLLFSAGGVAGGTSIACVTSGSSFSAAGYRQTAFGYDVAFHDATTKSMSGPDWLLDNHRYDEITGVDAPTSRVATAWQRNGTPSREPNETDHLTSRRDRD